MKHFFGELIGTFILVFIGCGSVGISILNSEFTLNYIAIAWCFAVAIAIFVSRKLSNAHLNPAVSLAMLLAKNINSKEFLKYINGQFLGAFIGAITLYFIFNSNLTDVENTNNIIRDSLEGIQTGKMFGEYYTNNTLLTAFVAEGLGTFILVLMIFILTSKKLNHKILTPIFIGMVVSIIIWFVAPISQAGLNPARDLAPRIVSYFFGWKSIAFSSEYYGWFFVYVAAPMFGGTLGFIIYKNLAKNLKTAL